MIFVDHANVLKNLEKFKGRIDWERFGYVLAFGSHLVGKIMYLGLPQKVSKEKRKFLKSLEICGYVVQPLPVQESPSGEKRQKGVDVFMYKDITELAEEGSYDKAIIVSGDGDLVEAVRKLRELGKKFEIWSFKKSLSRNLVTEAGEENINYIENILDSVEFRN